MKLFNARKNAVDEIGRAHAVVTAASETPYEYRAKLEKTHIVIRDFNDIANLKSEGELAARIGGAAGAVAAAGVGVGLLGSTAAMAIATTFGTASTGTAIATLSGVASTNAALAWLGGGALAAGGGGMAAGSSLLALISPVGWAIVGVTIVIGWLFAGSENMRIAKVAERKVIALQSEIDKIVRAREDIFSMYHLTLKETNRLMRQSHKVEQLIRPNLLSRARNYVMSILGKEERFIIKDGRRSFFNLAAHEKADLQALVNNSRSLAALVEKKFG